MPERAEKPDLHVVAGGCTDLDSLSDDDLMGLVREGYEEAFVRVVERYQSVVWVYAARFLGDKQAGRDVAQDVFAALWQERERYQARGRLKAYLLTLAFHRCNTHARNRRTRLRKLEQLCNEATPALENTPLDEVVAFARRRDIHRQLLRLPEATRQALVLHYIDDLSIDEIARATGRPPGTIKSHLFRGVRRLRRRMRKERP